MAKLAPLCDVPGCGGARLRWQRLCDRCFRRLPGELRVGITEARHQRRNGDWNRLRRRAAEFLNSLARPAVSPERAAELTARHMGERP